MKPGCPECERLWQILVDATDQHFVTKNKYELGQLRGLSVAPSRDASIAADDAYEAARAAFHGHEKTHGSQD